MTIANFGHSIGPPTSIVAASAEGLLEKTAMLVLAVARGFTIGVVAALIARSRSV